MTKEEFTEVLHDRLAASDHNPVTLPGKFAAIGAVGFVASLLWPVVDLAAQVCERWKADEIKTTGDDSGNALYSLCTALASLQPAGRREG